MDYFSIIIGYTFRLLYTPSVTVPEKHSIDKESLLKFFFCKDETLNERELFAQDVCILSFCLVGMNTADLFDIDKDCLKDDWKLCYNRKKQETKEEMEHI